MLKYRLDADGAPRPAALLISKTLSPFMIRNVASFQLPMAAHTSAKWLPAAEAACAASSALTTVASASCSRAAVIGGIVPGFAA
ncbi:MAG: hypothetical protein AMXMBFR37_16630 [Steroidobacteraceae bacterium]